MRSNLPLQVVLSLSFAGAAAGTHAANFCVGNATDLQDALTTAASNGEDDTVRIKAGSYAGGSGVAFAYSTGQNNAITISGGWFDISIFDCILSSNDPLDTVLSGSNLRPVLLMSGSSGTSGAMTLENLTLFNGKGSEFGGLRMANAANFTGNLLVDRVYFFSNVSDSFAAGAIIGSDGGTVTLRNSWFRSNACGQDRTCAAEVIVNDPGNSSSPRALVGNNTVTGNLCAVPETCGNGGLYVGGSAIFAIFNNAFYDNDGSDLRLQAENVLFNNFYQLQDGGVAPTFSSGNINPANPGFVDAGAGNFRLLATSPLVNAGTGAYLLGDLDFDGNERLNDFQYDIGAFENDNVIFKSGFEVLL